MKSRSNVCRFASSNLDRKEDIPGYAKLVECLAKDDKRRVSFLKACLKKLGLNVSKSDQLIPSLSSLHLTADNCAAVANLTDSWKDIIAIDSNNVNLLLGENDTFRLQRQSAAQTVLTSETPDDNGREETLAAVDINQADGRKDTPGKSNTDANGILDLAKVVKNIIIHEKELPTNKETPFFNHHAYYANLKLYNEGKQDDIRFGQYLLYGEVVTSTSTLLEK